MSATIEMDDFAGDVSWAIDQEKQRLADRLHTIRRQPIPAGKGWQERRGLLDASEAILSQ